MKQTNDDQAITQQILTNQNFRQQLTQKSFLHFFVTYFHDYITHALAPFHHEMLQFGQDQNTRLTIIAGFRGCGKTTILCTALPLWAIMGIQKRKNILIISQTMAQSKMALRNIKDAIAGNTLLRRDFGPFHEEEDDWHATSIVVPNFEARITAVSIDTSIRSFQQRARRPDLVILDDIEDFNSTRSREMRDKTSNWVMTEAMLVGDQNTKYIMLGNVLHEDSTLMRLKNLIESGVLTGQYRAYPIINDDGNPSWPGLYPTKESIEDKKRSVGNEVIWYREFLLRIISSDEAIILKEWIKRYQYLPKNQSPYLAIIGTDVATGKEKGDKTAMIGFFVYGYGENATIYVLPDMINERLTTLQNIERAKNFVDKLRETIYKVTVIGEDVAYQVSFAEILKKIYWDVVGIKIGGTSKAVRLEMIAHLVEAGVVYFPENGAEQLIDQLVNFGVEKYDDLADAFSLGLGYLVNKGYCRISFNKPRGRKKEDDRGLNSREIFLRRQEMERLDKIFRDRF